MAGSSLLASLLAGALLSLMIAVVAHRRQALDGGGAMAATVVGTLVFGLGGWSWAVVLVLFFVTSSALSRWCQAAKDTTRQRGAKGGRRDGRQVAANGGIAAALALLSAMAPSAAWYPMFFGSVAAVTADTWATEIGCLSRRPPRSILSGRPVAAGTSGGVSWLGSGAAMLGAALIGLVAGVADNALDWEDALIIGTVAGTIGAGVDSVIGAAGQAVFRCDACDQETETRIHRCGRPARLIGGCAWLDNDGVNALAAAAGAVGGWLSWLSIIG